MTDLLKSHNRRFFISLFPEEGPESCKHENCDRKRIRNSVMCAKHHYEMILKKPCPWDDKFSDLSEKERALIEREKTRMSAQEKDSGGGFQRENTDIAATESTMERNLTKGPKLGFLRWGLAGGFISGKMPGSTLGTIGVAVLFLGAVKHYRDPTVLPLAFVFLIVAVALIYGGYQSYSKAYDREMKEFNDEMRGADQGK